MEEDPAGGFEVDFPEDNIFGLDPDVLGLAATQGVCLMTRPLSPGQHTIEFGGTDTLGPFSLDVKYTITVLPKGLYNKLPVRQPAMAGQGTFSSGPSLASSFFESDDRLLV